MSELKQALERWEIARPVTLDGQKGVFVAPATDEDALTLFEAARRWDALDSPETIENIAKIIYDEALPSRTWDKRGRITPFEDSMSPKAFRIAAQAVVRVLKGETP